MSEEDVVYLWQDDFNKLFDFNDYKHYFDDYTIDEIKRIVYETDENYLGKLQIIRTGNLHLLITEKGEAMAFDQPAPGIDTTVKENLEWFICPKYSNEKGELMRLSGFDGIWKNKWLETNEPLKNVIISGVTDFYEKFECWPYWENKPLSFYGEILVDNRTAYVFMDLYSGDLYKDGTYDSAFITFGGNKTDSEHIEMRSLKLPYPSWLDFLKEYALEDEDPFYPEKRYAPEGKLLNCLQGCQDWIPPEKDCNIPLYHLPVDFRFGEKENSGNWGSMMIFWDGKESFYTSYQQT